MLPARCWRQPWTRAVTKARFSCATRRLNEQPPARHAEPAKTDVKEKSEERKEDGGGKKANKRGGGAALPAFALFAIGVPLGWYLNNRDPQSTTTPVGPTEFVRYGLLSRDSVSSTAAIFRLAPSTNRTVDLDDPALERAITSVEFKQPQLQIARSYTCLPQERGQHMDELRFLIRREPKGEVSNFLHRLPISSDIHLRGLHPEYILPDDVDSIVFLVGGTGIAPALQAADIIDGNVNMHILWASRRREDCVGGYNDTTPVKRSWTWWSSSTSPSQDATINAEKGALVKMLEDLKKRSVAPTHESPRLFVDYYVDEEGSFIKPDDVKKALATLQQRSSPDSNGRKILIVSGPEGFIKHWAGAKHWANGHEVQGPLRGVLSTFDLNGWEVVKL